MQNFLTMHTVKNRTPRAINGASVARLVGDQHG
jgi:hypothetical protein